MREHAILLPKATSQNFFPGEISTELQQHQQQ